MSIPVPCNGLAGDCQLPAAFLRDGAIVIRHKHYGALHETVLSRADILGLLGPLVNLSVTDIATGVSRGYIR